jgi:hypothetical protein
MHTREIAAACLCAVLVLPAPAGAWGGKGHSMQAQTALEKLPAGMPPFFTSAVEQLKALASEPDRWRTGEQPSLAATTGPDHSLKWEIVPKPLPRNRYQFIIQLVQSGKLAVEKVSVQDFGSSPYAIAEWAEMLTGAFRRWRAAPESTAAERASKRHHEQSILFMAGILAHWTTDGSNPMHVSIHIHGWSPLVPNPNGYEGKDLHARYESKYLDAAVGQQDVARFVKEEPRLLGNWLSEAADYIEACNRHVEQIYIWDKTAPFGSGQEPAEARPFTAARLADGARMLRDVWYSAWVKSGLPAPAK